MSTETVTDTPAVTAEAPQTSPEASVDSVRKEERLRVSREEKLRIERDEAVQKASAYEEKLERMKKSGWDPDTLANTDNTFKTAPDPTKEIQTLSEQIRTMQKQLQQKDHESMRNSQLSEIQMFVDRNAEDFELIKVNGAQDDVLRLIENYYAQNKRMLTLKEAAMAVEKDLEKGLEEYSKTLQSSKKASKYLTPTSKPQAAVTPGKKEEPVKPTEKKTPFDKPTAAVRYDPITPQVPKQSPGVANHMGPNDYLANQFAKFQAKKTSV